MKTDQKWTQKLNFDVKSDYHSTPNVPATSPQTSLSVQVYRCDQMKTLADGIETPRGDQMKIESGGVKK